MSVTVAVVVAENNNLRSGGPHTILRLHFHCDTQDDGGLPAAAEDRRRRNMKEAEEAEDHHL